MKLWIARDNSLYMYKSKPYKSVRENYFQCKSIGYKIYRLLFPEITFENSPQQVELKLLTDKE